MVSLLILVNYVVTLFLVLAAMTGAIHWLWAMLGIAALIWAEYLAYRRSATPPTTASRGHA